MTCSAVVPCGAGLGSIESWDDVCLCIWLTRWFGVAEARDNWNGAVPAVSEREP